MAVQKRASVIWNGSLHGGLRAAIDSTASGAFGGLERDAGPRARSRAAGRDEPRGADRGRARRRASRWRSRTGSRRPGTPPERARGHRDRHLPAGEGITQIAARRRAAASRHRRRPRFRGGGRGREGRTARSRRRSPASRDHARRRGSRARSRAVYPVAGMAGIARARRRARALLPRGAGADVRPCRLQRPPRGGGGRAAAEGARGAAPARRRSGAQARADLETRAADADLRELVPELEQRLARARGGAEARARRDATRPTART